MYNRMYGSSCKVETTVNRPTASAYMLVDSLDRYGNDWPNAITVTSSADWRLNFQTPVLQGYFTRLCLTQLQYNWNTPTILTDYNDTLFFRVVGGAAPNVLRKIKIPTGWYDPTTLATAIEDAIQALNAAYADFTFVFNETAGAFQLNTNDDTTGVAFYNFSSDSTTANTVRRTLLTVGLMNVTVPNIETAAETASDTVFGNVPTMLATRFVDICSSYLTKYQKVKDSSTLISAPRQDMLVRLYAVAPNTRIDLTETISPGSYPFVITQDMNNPKFMKWSPDEALNNFDIQLRDEFGDILSTDAVYMPEYLLSFMATED